jgi:PAS domain S-box-containing protein
MFKSLQTRIMISIIGIVLISLVIPTYYLGRRAKQELSDSYDISTANLVQTTKQHIESEYNGILNYKKATLVRRKKELVNNTQIAFSLIDMVYREFLDGIISEDTAKQRVIDEFRQLRYEDETGYFWINNTRRPFPEMIMHPTMSDLDGTILDDPLFNCAIGKEINLFRATVDISLENGEGFVDYLWPKPVQGGLTGQQPKLSFVKIFKPWNWIIGTGVYIDDIQKNVQNRIDNMINNLNNTVSKQRIGESGYLFIFNEDNYLLVHPNLAGTDGSNLINPESGHKLLPELKKTAFSSDISMEYLWDKPGFENEYRFRKKAYITYIKSLSWYIGNTFYKEDLESEIEDLIDRMLLFSILYLTLSIIISILISRSIAIPIENYVRSIKKTDRDGIPVDSIPKTRITEIQTLGSTINSMIDSIKKTRKELKDQSNLSLSIINSAPYIIYGMDPDGIITFINPAGEKISAYTERELVGKNWRELFHPGGENRQLENLFVDPFGEAGIDYEMKLITKDEKQKDIIWNSFAAKNNSEIIGFGYDITESNQMEKTLRINEKRYRNLVANIPGATYRCACDEEWTMEFFSNGIKNLSGYSNLDFKDNNIRSYNSVIHPEDRQFVNNKVMEGVNSKKPFTIEYRIIHKDGEIRWVFEKGRGVFDENGKLTCLDGVIHDITERKLTEKELRHVRNYLSNIINSMPSVLVGVDEEGKITQWNRTAEQSTGITAVDAQGQALAEIFPQMASEMSKINKSIKTRKTMKTLKNKRQTEKGIIFEDIVIYPLMANGSEGAVIRIDDITEKVRLEEMMIQSKKMLSIGGLAAGMAHEINNPLAGIMQSAKVMSLRLGEEPNISANMRAAEDAGTNMEAIINFMEIRGIPRMLNAINESGKRLADIVNNMLSFARKSDSSISSYSIPDLMEKTLEIAASDYNLKMHYDFKQIKIRKEYDDNLPLLQCEGNKIQQVLLNILRNGAQAMQEHGTTSPVFIVRINFNMGSNMIIIEIEDNGPGIEKSIQNRIFEPFFTTKTAGSGTGLGLSMSYFIITENHGGEMTVDTHMDSGTRFIIKLPVKGV